MNQIPYLGEVFALAAPICWAFAIILFRRTGERVTPLALNLFKNSLALLLFLVTYWMVRPEVGSGIGSRDRWLLIASGAIGIGVADTLFFMTLNRVGAALQAIINTSYSPSIILLSYLFLGERLRATQWIGVILILSAVLSVTRMRGPSDRGLRRSTLLAGIACGMAANGTQAISIVMIKPLLDHSSLIWANCWRMLGGLLASILLLRVMPGWRRVLASLKDRRVWPVMIPGSILGTYISLIFWLAGMKYTLASTASALNQTATLWTFLLAAILLREPVTAIRSIGLGLGLIGVALVTFG